MKIKTLNKAMILALLSLSLVACTSSNSQQSSPEVNTDQVENSDDNTNEIVEEAKADNDNDMENTDSKENKTDDEADKTTTIEVKKSDSAENKDKKESTDKKEANGIDDKNLKDKDGVYSSSLMSEKNGEREAELSTASVYDILAEEGKLTVKGSIDYQVDPKDYKNLEELENDSYTFKIDENTEFLSGGGMTDPTYYKTIEEFNNFYKEVKNSGLGLVITVKDGLVKSVLITS